MRTTLNIKEDALAYAKERARASGQSLGEVVSEVLREAARPRAGGIELSEDGMPYIPAKAGSKQVSSERVRDALDREEIEKHAFTRR
ncbi:MAG: antitoxin [Oceanipulchritudo sp.]